jgi:MOSC domain-containing protein YiiM
MGSLVSQSPERTTAAVLEAIFLAPSAGATMRRVVEARVLAGAGLEGDRYALGTGYYSNRYDCEVTLIEAEALEEIEHAGGPRVADGQHRRNLVTRGVRLRELEGRRMRIGEVVLEYHRPRPPCDYLERQTEPGMTRALGRGAGIGMRVIKGGTLCQGMEIFILPRAGPAPRRLP